MAGVEKSDVRWQSGRGGEELENVGDGVGRSDVDGYGFAAAYLNEDLNVVCW